MPRHFLPGALQSRAMGRAFYGKTTSFFGHAAEEKQAVHHKQGFALRAFGTGTQRTVQVCVRASCRCMSCALQNVKLRAGGAEPGGAEHPGPGQGKRSYRALCASNQDSGDFSFCRKLSKTDPHLSVLSSRVVHTLQVQRKEDFTFCADYCSV